MGTRSLTRVIQRQEGVAYDKGHKMIKKSIINMYQQYDGYPSYVGVKLAEFIKITTAGVIESHPHDVTITREAPNYSR